MSPRSLADLAVALTCHADELSASGGPEATALHRVWKRSARCFSIWRKELASAATPRLYAELFAMELPLRVWYTAVAASGASTPAASGPAVAAKLFTELLDLRCMALQALAADHGLTTTEAAALDRFRRRCERWTDVLLAPLAARSGVTDYVVCPSRAADFAATSDGASGDASWPLVKAGLALTFAVADEFRPTGAEPNADPAASLAAAMLASFPTAAFSSDGRFRPPVIARATRTVAETAPTRPRRSLHAASPAVPPPAAPTPIRPSHAISFSSLRKRKPTE